jgi:hypothetical protein
LFAHIAWGMASQLPKMALAKARRDDDRGAWEVPPFSRRAGSSRRGDVPGECGFQPR